MASIRREFDLSSSPARVWDVLRDAGEVHRRLAPGFVVNTVLEADSRVVTFANGMTVRERIVAIDDAGRRFAYSAVGGRATHHNAYFEVSAGPDGGAHVVWVTDVLPHDVADAIGGMMDAGIVAIRRTFGSDAR